MRKSLLMKTTWIMGLMLLLSGCIAYFNPPLILGERDDHIWVGRHDSTYYMLRIDSVRDDIWFRGILTRNVSDTLFVRGFEKGNHYLTWLRTVEDDSVQSSEIGQISLWVRGMRADTVDVINTRDSIPFLPIRMRMVKVKKPTMAHGR